MLCGTVVIWCGVFENKLQRSLKVYSIFRMNIGVYHRCSQRNDIKFRIIATMKDH